MKKLAVVFLMLVLIAIIMLSNGCAGTTNIGDITANPSQYQGKEVSIKGTVDNDFWFALLTKGAYRVTDATGSIWVVTSQSPPGKGTEVKVKGTAERAITIGDRSLGTVIIEKSRG